MSTATTSVRTRTQSGAGLEPALSFCDELLASHLAAVERRFGAAALGVVDLPALGPAQLVAEQVRVGAVLYWAREIEATGLLAFVETLGRGLLRGSVQVPLGNSVRRIVSFYRARDRFGPRERHSLYASVFGPSSGAETFEGQLEQLMRGLSAIGRQAADQGIAHLEARARVLAQTVGERLSRRAVGLAGFAARDIVGQLRTCLAILREPDVERAFGGGPPLAILQRHAALVLGREVSVRPHLTRANEGGRVLAWIAANAAPLSTGALRIDRADPVIQHAETWLAAGSDG